MAITLSQIKSLAQGVSSLFSNKAKFNIEGEALPLHVQFNPEQYKVTEAVRYNTIERTGSDDTHVEYVGSVASSVQLSFYFDTSDVTAVSGIGSKMASDVSVLTRKFSNLVKMKGELHRPPIVEFIWGSTHFVGFVTQVATTFTMFDSSGMPIRAKVDATMQGVPTTTSGKKSPLESPDRTKSRVISEDTNIWSLAKKEYDDISQWRVIAKANGIMDPLDIMPGTVLKVPALKD